MKRMCSTIKNATVLGIAAAAAAAVSCADLTQWLGSPLGDTLPLNEDGRPIGWTDETHGKGATPNYDVVFAQDKVNRLDLTIAPDDWQAMQDDMTDLAGTFGAAGGGQAPPGGSPPDGGPPAGGGPPPADGDFSLLPRNPIYVPCTVAFEGQTWWYVGIRFKGNSTLLHPWQIGVAKLPLKLDFDEFEDSHPEIDDQRFFGFKRLALGNNFNDSSLLREKVTHDIFREAGVPAPRTAFYRVFVDFGEGSMYFGLYTMTEVPESPMFGTQFGEDGGNLYKPEGSGATWISLDQESFPKMTNQSEGDWSDVQAAIAALHADRSEPAAWRANLEATFNVDGFLRWLAVNTLVQNWDSYGNTPQNYYLYADPADAWRLYWIPWDCNEAFKSTALGQPFAPLSLELDEVNENWPLIRYLRDDPVYWAAYVSHVQEVIETVLAVEATRQRFLTAHDLIAPYVTGADGELPGYTFLRDPQEFDTELDNLLRHVEQRHNAAIEFLEADHG
jgi:hypothetical protein